MVAGLVFSGLLIILPAPYSGWLLLVGLVMGIAAYAYQERHRWTDPGFPIRIHAILRHLPHLLRVSTTQAGLLSLVAVLFSAYILAPTAKGRLVILALPAVIIGGVAFWYAMRNQSAPSFVIVKIQPARIRLLPLISGLLLLVILAEFNGNLLHIEAFQQVSSHLQFAYLCFGCLFVVWGLAGELPHSRRRDVLTYSTLLVLLITALALLLRLWQLGDAIHMFVDELNFSNAILYIAKTQTVDLLQRNDPTMAFPYLFAYYYSRTYEGRIEAHGKKWWM